MSLGHGILGFLSYGEMSGYDLAKAFDYSVDFFWHAQRSHIYLELNKLEKSGYVCCKLVAQTDKPNKKLYSITEAGRSEFLRWLSADTHDFSKELKSSFLMKLFFSGIGAPAQCLARLKAFAADCRAYLARMDAIPASIRQYEPAAGAEQAVYWAMTADFGRRYMELSVAWAEDCIGILERRL